MARLKELRTAQQLSQAALAEKAGVSFRMLQHYEQGYKDINKAQGGTLYKLAQALSCSIEDILEIEKID